MKTKEAISINNSLVHGICNFNCITCGINKPTYKGPKAFQPLAVTQALIDRIREAGREGIYVRYVANSGDGEPTLHPSFMETMNLYGKLISSWDTTKCPAPEVSVVTNGFNLRKKGIMAALERNQIHLKISLPTLHPRHYGTIMMMNPEHGQYLLKHVTPAVEKTMASAAKGKLKSLEFHISPPHEMVLSDFPKTIEILTKLAKKNRLHELNLLIFPVTSNRGGRVRNTPEKVNNFLPYFEKYNGKVLNGVTVNMKSVIRRFYHNYNELIDLYKAFDYPCIWYRGIFLSHSGDSVCCNDQNIEEPRGNIQTSTLREIIEKKEDKLATALCRKCNQAPEKIGEEIFLHLLQEK